MWILRLYINVYIIKLEIKIDKDNYNSFSIYYFIELQRLENNNLHKLKQITKNHCDAHIWVSSYKNKEPHPMEILWTSPHFPITQYCGTNKKLENYYKTQKNFASLEQT